jgi:hypothetical protein
MIIGTQTHTKLDLPLQGGRVIEYRPVGLIHRPPLINRKE